MSRRAIGGGRVLGSGKSLAPAPPPSSTSPTPVVAATAGPHNAHLLSPSASTISLNSGTSTPISNDADLGSRVSLDQHMESSVAPAAAAAGARMVCPICNEEMVTLLQLNRHLDDVHKEIEGEQQAEVEDWFKKQMVKAKKFQPLAVLNQKLKGLDVFESNDEVAAQAAEANVFSRRSSDPSLTSTMNNAAPTARTPLVDSDEAVTRKHWQKAGYDDRCSDPECRKRLGTSNGQVNCRHCGKLFCDEHTMYQMKLSRSAQHEPIRGFWCRVCETCYKSRDGYNDKSGLERDHMKDFAKARGVNVDKIVLEVSRLEKRLTRLTQLLANPPEDVQQESKRWSLSWNRPDPIKAIEQSVVSWQDDNEVARCPYCQQDFSTYSFRRHHCRTCGKVVCADPATGCSTVLGLTVATSEFPFSFSSDDVELALS